ncbi:NAD-dependent succinate-semialdehyde dehydrogenase [Paraburkholderia sediminicola]|nr:NAD-dependent succinate-semialdehyde dehydrogenase [Paraburkholderia sediminicola]
MAVTYYDLNMLIDGEWISAKNRETLAVLNPATGEEIGRLPVATRADLDRAAAASARAFGEWKALSAYSRAKVLVRAAAILRERAPDIAHLMTVEQGKPLAEAQMEVRNLPDILEWDAEEGRRTYGRVIPSRVPEQRQIVIKEPVGPVATFTPWNFPALIPARKIAAVLAAGCTCIIKPAEETPATALAIARAFVDAGVPPGVLNVVFGRTPAEVSEALISSPHIRAISFTGSTAVGKHLSEMAARGVKRTVMELGGHAPVIVMPDVDVEGLAEQAARRKYRNGGQGCVNPTRFYVHDSVYERFAARFVEIVRSIKPGNGLDSDTQMGPLAHARRVDAMKDCVDDARRHGGKVLCGGEPIEGRGFFFQPTVLADVPGSAHIMKEEPFGPIVVLNRFTDLDAVLREANGLPYGLAAYAFTRDGALAHRLSMQLEAGMIGINTFALGAPDAIGAPETPFGGVKESGYGSEGGTEGIDAYLTVKLISQF